MDNVEVVERGNIVVNIYEGQKGATGEPGKSLRFEDLTPEQIEQLKGPKGDKGEAFTYADFTQDQLEALKGPKGDKGDGGRDGASATADNAHQLLLQGNVWCESARVDNVITTLIGNIGKPFPRTDIKPLTFTQPTKGQTELSLQGEDHYKVSLEGGELVEVVNGSAYHHSSIWKI